MTEIIPGILEKDWPAVEQKIELIRPFAKTIHVDLLDGKFAPNTSFLDPEPFAAYKKDFVLELHMMVDDPVSYVDAWAAAGFRRFIGQVEKMPDQVAFVKKVHSLHQEVGLGIDAGTQVEEISIPFADLDFLFVMTVKAGFSHQSFLPECLEKVVAIRSMTDKPIEVDGGINDKTIIIAKEAGATRFVSTGFLFGKENVQKQYDMLYASCTKP